MSFPKRVSLWSVEEVLEWVQDQFPAHMGTLHKAIIKHAISGRVLLRLKDHHLELLGVEAEEQQQEIWQDLLLLRVQEEICELDDICSDCFRIYDLNGDNYISRDVPRVMISFITQPTEEDPDEGVKNLVEITMKKIDHDHDGRLSFTDVDKSVREENLLLEASGTCLPDIMEQLDQ